MPARGCDAALPGAVQQDHRPGRETSLRLVGADVDGHLVGFYTPGFVPSVNVPGYHFHFIDRDFTAGGHLLSCAPERLDIRLQIFTGMELTLPRTLDYLTATFTRDARKDLEKAER